MTDKELRRLCRQELLELLLEQREENEALRQQRCRTWRSSWRPADPPDRSGDHGGSRPEAQRVFEAADRAVRQYLQSVRRAQEEGTLRHG